MSNVVDTFGAFRDRAGRVCLVLAPLLFAAGLATVPGFSPSLAGSLAHPAQAQASALLLHLGWLAFVPAVLHLSRDAARWARVIAAVVVLALVSFSALMVGDYTSIATAEALDPATAARVDASLGDYAPFTLGWVLPSMALTLLGRSR
ncbi:hypothetical protein [Dactylosporangium sp. NPDC051484]|uniref:hypothetical protein n=1 Tax=Dactylosporangium sp. NPDC051484 TaxID=3154942 RepID=UPI00344E0CB7